MADTNGSIDLTPSSSEILFDDIGFEDSIDSRRANYDEFDALVPSWANDVTVSQLSPVILRYLSLLLDTSTSEDVICSWKDLAHKLGVSGEEIEMMGHRVRFPESPCSKVLSLFRDASLHHLLSTIKYDLGRVDILINMQHLLEDMAIVCQGNAIRCAETLQERSVALPNNEQVGGVQRAGLAGNRDNFSTASADSARYSLDSAFGDVPRDFQGDHNHLILVCYAKDDGLHVRKALQLIYNLKKHGEKWGFATVSLEVSELARNADVMSRVDSSFQLATHVLVVCSPLYQRITDLSETRIGESLTTEQFILRYVHRLMTVEFRDTRAKNYRFRPVVFSDEDASFVPLFLRSTVIYVWPRMHSDLCRFLFLDGAS